MTWIAWAKTYCLTFLVFLAVDFLWLGLIAKDLYQRYLGHLFSEQVNWPAAFLFYLIFVFGIMVFVVSPALKVQAWGQALTLGLVFGLVTYATFDLTSLALFKGWPTAIVVVDILWGVVLSGTVSTAGYLIARWLS
jgi:uncharacterized membrane protein